MKPVAGRAVGNRCGCGPSARGKIFEGILHARSAVNDKPSTASRNESVAAKRGVSLIRAGSSSSNGAVASDAPPKPDPVDLVAKARESGLPRVLIAGGGIGGLVAAVALLKRGYPVQVFERDLTAIRGEGKYRGPIQVQSNALAALEAIDEDLAEKILSEGCVTGDRVNGLCDGVTGDWYVKFDTFHPAVDIGLPVTRVISRVLLQKVLAEKAEQLGGIGVVLNDSNVVDFEERVESDGRKTVSVVLESGERHQGEILIGADGIWSKVRTKLIGETSPNYSEYTCYTGISDFVPPDIDTVGYRVFLGNGRYFVSSDVGGGKMQWYGFHKEPAGGKDPEGKQKERLLQIFGDWADAVTDLIRATPEDDVIRRDIYDRPPIFQWAKGRVALLGDSAHAMQPNLGQGGCMAIEDGYQLAETLDEVVDSAQPGQPVDLEGALKIYQQRRILRASSIHGLAGMAAIMASTYKAYLGEGLGDMGQWLMKFKIPHPGRVGGKVAMDLTMPAMLAWVLGGNVDALSFKDRVPHCRLLDLPKAFSERQFGQFMRDDAALLKAANAQWALTPVAQDIAQWGSEPTDEAARTICEGTPVTVGSSSEADVVISDHMVAGQHAQLVKDDGHHYLISPQRTWLNDKQVPQNQRVRLRPGDVLAFGSRECPNKFKVKMYHRDERERLERSFQASAAEKDAGREAVAA